MSTLIRSLRIGRELARIGSAIVAERVETGYVFNPLLNPLLRQAREWPYPLYQRLRERDPIHRSRAIRGWFLFRHADCLTVLRDGRFSADCPSCPALLALLQDHRATGTPRGEH